MIEITTTHSCTLAAMVAWLLPPALQLEDLHLNNPLIRQIACDVCRDIGWYEGASLECFCICNGQSQAKF